MVGINGCVSADVIHRYVTSECTISVVCYRNSVAGRLCHLSGINNSRGEGRATHEQIEICIRGSTNSNIGAIHIDAGCTSTAQMNVVRAVKRTREYRTPRICRGVRDNNCLTSVLIVQCDVNVRIERSPIAYSNCITTEVGHNDLTCARNAQIGCRYHFACIDVSPIALARQLDGEVAGPGGNREHILGSKRSRIERIRGRIVVGGADSQIASKDVSSNVGRNNNCCTNLVNDRITVAGQRNFTCGFHLRCGLQHCINRYQGRSVYRHSVTSGDVNADALIPSRDIGSILYIDSDYVQTAEHDRIIRCEVTGVHHTGVCCTRDRDISVVRSTSVVILEVNNNIASRRAGHVRHDIVDGHILSNAGQCEQFPIV